MMIRKIQQRRSILLTVFASVVLTGCGMMGTEQSDPVTSASTPPLKVELPPTMAEQLQPAPPPGQRAGGRCGNEPSYTLNGRSYQVLPSASGYREDGMASRYGAEYHGTKTAGCETFNRHAFTAAHRTLPLPSFVRVTNLSNNKRVIVKVNDRGPFTGDGLIQLSAAAAGTLGMTAGSAAARVRLEAVGEGAAGKTLSSIASGRQAAAGVARKIASTPRRKVRAVPPTVNRPTPAQAAAIKKARKSGKSFFVVVKNYQQQAKALDMFVRLTSVGLNKTEMASAISRGSKVHQVRVGPLYTQDQIDKVKDTLAGNGLATFRVVEVDE